MPSGNQSEFSKEELQNTVEHLMREAILLATAISLGEDGELMTIKVAHMKKEEQRELVGGGKKTKPKEGQKLGKRKAILKKDQQNVSVDHWRMMEVWEVRRLKLLPIHDHVASFALNTSSF